MKPMSPQQIEATIAIVRAASAGDPLDDSHTLRGHLAMVLGALDEARREVAFRLDRERSIIEACERVADGGQYRADIVGAIERIRRERDDARAALVRAQEYAVRGDAKLSEQAHEVARLRTMVRALGGQP